MAHPAQQVVVSVEEINAVSLSHEFFQSIEKKRVENGGVRCVRRIDEQHGESAQTLSVEMGENAEQSGARLQSQLAAHVEIDFVFMVVLPVRPVHVHRERHAPIGLFVGEQPLTDELASCSRAVEFITSLRGRFGSHEFHSRLFWVEMSAPEKVKLSRYVASELETKAVDLSFPLRADRLEGVQLRACEK